MLAQAAGTAVGSATKLNVTGGIVLVFIIGGVLWAIFRARKGYQAVQTLMARVEASASAESKAAAMAANHVHVALAGQDEREVVWASSGGTLEPRNEREAAVLRAVLADLRGEPRSVVRPVLVEGDSA